MTLPKTLPLPARRLRIAVLTRTFSPTAGGAERYAMALVERLSDKHDFHVFSQKIEHHWPGVTYHLVSMPLRRPRWLNQLWFATATWWVTRTGFDVVHSHENTWHGNVQTVHVLPIKYNLFNGRTGWTLALRCLKVMTSPRLLVYLLLERMRYAVRKGRAVVLISETLRKSFAASYPQAMAMTCVITPGIALPALAVSDDMRRAARQQLGLPENKFCALFIGNDLRKKGLPALMAALRLLPDEVVLAVVGNSAQLAYYRQQAVLMDLAPRVFFVGALQDVSPAYLAADCLVHPTLEDTFAMVVLEAMAHGLPVVVSSAKYCGISGLLAHQVNALLLDDPQDVQALAACLLRVLTEAPLRTSLGHAARIFAARFDWAGIAEQQEKLYYATAQGAGKVSPQA